MGDGMIRQSCFGSHSVVVRSDGLSISETTHSSALRTPAHAHPFSCLHFVLQGLYEESRKGESHRVEPGHLLYKPRGQVHWNAFQAVGAVTLRFELRHTTSPALTEALPNRMETLRNPHLALLAGKVHAELMRSDDLTPVIVESIAMELFAAVARMSAEDARSSSSLARRCADLLDERFRESYRLGLAAEELGVDRTVLARAFRREYGCSVGEYLRRRRVQLVAERLRGGGHTQRLADLAADVGFADQSHMTRVFKAELGEPPGSWRSRFAG